MPTRTPIPVSRAMRQISANLDLARRQQRIPVALLAERAGLSMPTVTKMLRTGNGSFENFLRIARLLGLLDGVQQATDPLNTDIGKLRADEDTPKRVVPEFLRTLVFARPRGDDQFADCTFSPSLDMSR